MGAPVAWQNFVLELSITILTIFPSSFGMKKPNSHQYWGSTSLLITFEQIKSWTFSSASFWNFSGTCHSLDMRNGTEFLVKIILILGMFIGSSPSLSLNAVGYSVIISGVSSLLTVAEIFEGKFGEIIFKWLKVVPSHEYTVPTQIRCHYNSCLVKLSKLRQILDSPIMSP